jgi:hypothetical protein
VAAVADGAPAESPDSWLALFDTYEAHAKHGGLRLQDAEGE